MKDAVLPLMNALRACGDRLETMTEQKAWPFPTYDELLFHV